MSKKNSRKKSGGTRRKTRKQRSNHHGGRPRRSRDHRMNDEDLRSRRNDGRRSVKKSLNKLNSIVEMTNGYFNSEDEMAINSLDMSFKRPSKTEKRMARMQAAVKYTDKNHLSTLGKELRKFPIEFVKAQEVYNPSEDMIKNILSKNNHVEEKDELMKAIEEMDSGDEMDTDESTDMKLGEVSDEKPEIKETPAVKETPPVEVTSDSSSLEESIEIVDDNENSGYESDTPEFSNANSEKLYREQEEDARDIPIEVDSDEQPTLRFGQVDAPVFTNSKGETFIDLPKRGKGTDLPSQTDKHQEPEEPEFGFLSEDYMIPTISDMKFDNVRKGMNGARQYHINAYDITGTHNYEWVSSNDFKDAVLEVGLPESRFDAFMKYLSENVYTGEEPLFDDFNEDDISETELEDEELSDELLEGMDDMIKFKQNQVKVLEDPIDIDTHELTTHGHGSKRRLDIPDSVDPDMSKALTDKFESRMQGARKKREAREQKLKDIMSTPDDAEIVRNQYYLLKKYPYEMKLKDMQTELLAFVNDQRRKSLRFPPMDHNGCVMIKKLSKAFLLKPAQHGNSEHSYVIITKKSTKKLTPDYKKIHKLMNKTGIFFRSDVDLTKREKSDIRELLSKFKSGSKKKEKDSSSYTYKEGDIVGEGASEIGPESIGRRLLVKMGWQKGQGLGIDGNGIIIPVQAIVKKSKRGLK